MHLSVTKAREYKALDKARRKENEYKKMTRGLLVVSGHNPSFTPPSPNGTHDQRRWESRPERRRIRLIRNLCSLFSA